MTNNTPNPALVEEAVERARLRLEQSRRCRYVRGLEPADLRTLLAALPTDDDVERVARDIYTALGHEESLPWDRAVQVRQNHGWEGAYSRIQLKCIEAAKSAIHTLIGRAG